MNRRDIDAMRERLAARTAADTDDHPALYALAAFLFGLAVFMAFLI